VCESRVTEAHMSLYSTCTEYSYMQECTAPLNRTATKTTRCSQKQKDESYCSCFRAVPWA
jgi:hypothetical protein